MVEEITHRPRLPARFGPLKTLLPVALVMWGFVGVYLVQLGIDGSSRERLHEKAVEEMMYFPSGKFMRQASIEYEMFVSDIVWLRAIQYYGHHLMTDRKYEWLGHVFEILTALDPRFIGAYHFGALTLAWDAEKPNEAIRLLVEGMKRNPMNWQLPFDAGFISYMQLRDYETAGKYFKIASELPGAWHIVSRWAAMSTAKAGSFAAARDLWVDIYNGTENRKLRELVVRQVRKLNFEEGLQNLQAEADRFFEDRGRRPRSLLSLVRAGYVDRIPKEPYGGRYYLADGEVRSTTPPHMRE